MKTNIHLCQYHAQFFLECQIFQTKFAEKIKKHILYSINFILTKNRAVYDIMWKNIVQRERQQVTL